MSAISGGGNYISDGDIMSWLAIQQDRVYGDLQHSMDLSGERADFAQELNNIKAHLHDANRSHDFKKVNAELQDFLSKYGSDPNFADLCEGLRGMADKISSDLKVQTDYADKVKPPPADPTAIEHQEKPALRQNSQPNGARFHGGAPAKPSPQGYDENQMKDWDTAIDNQTGATSRNDQLTMIHIQQLKSNIDQGSQLGSTFIASSDKTSEAIIHNFA